jgi:hypothetical protein
MSQNQEETKNVEHVEHVEYYESDENDTDSNEVYDISRNMYKIEDEVWDVYCTLKEYSERGYTQLLHHVNFNDVYKLIYPDYKPPF